MIEPGERGSHIVQFAVAVVVFTVTQAGSAKIEAQHRKPKVVQRLHRVEHDFVMQSAAEHRVRMADEGGVCRGRGAKVKNGFETARGAFQKQRANRAGCGSHWD